MRLSNPSVFEPYNNKEDVSNTETPNTETPNSTLDDVNDYITRQQEVLQNNQQLFSQYDNDIKSKMQLVATRDRMLQLSQERNIYKQKIIYVLVSFIIALLIGSISVYTIFNR